MTPEKLKASILQYAIQGKLVEQGADEGTAEELYKKIQAEKQALIKNGKIKKEKPLPKIVEDEIPFDIPETWKWIRLSEVVDVRDGTHDTPEYVIDGYPLITGKDFYNGYFDLIKTQYISKSDYEEIIKRSKVDVGDILFSMIGGNIGSMIRITADNYFEMAIKNVALFKQYFENETQSLYLFYWLKSQIEQMKKHAKGGAQQFVSLNLLRAYPFPLPPLKEQKRIVEKIEELLPIVDRYAVAYDKLEKFNAKFPEDMKKAILQYAIQGKLVEQRVDEGTGDALYQQIVANREALIKENTIKRDKRTETTVNVDEVPFDIPENWKWVTLGSILNKLTDGTHKTPKYTASGVKFVSVKDMSNGYLSLDNTKFISEEEHKELYVRCNPEKGDIILSKVGTTGVPAIVDTDEEFSLFVSVALLKFDHKCIDKKFLYYMLMSPLVQAQAKENTRGVGNKNWVLDAIGNTMVVLPPLKEQIRIVEKLEKLLPYCDRLVKGMKK